MDKDAALNCVTGIMADLRGRRGFRAVLEDMDPDDKATLMDELAHLLQTLVLGHSPTAREASLGNGELALEAMRRLLESTAPGVTPADRIEAAKVLLGRG